MTLIRGILLILLGVYALINPLMAVAALVQVFGFYLVIHSKTDFCLAFRTAALFNRPRTISLSKHQ